MFRVLALLCALATSVQAKMMVHTDLAGLALLSDSVFLAERTSPGHYKVIKALRGTATGELALDDSLYDVPKTAAARCWVFVRGGRIASLRNVVDGKVVRYEQRNNPGGWDPVPQGQDPVDQWRTTPQLDVPAFEQALAAAFARADGLKAAVARGAKRDALLAFLAPSGDARAAGFYVDEIATAIEDVLAHDQDWVGLALAFQHDHSNSLRFRGHAKGLLSVVADRKQPDALRARAVAVAGEDFTEELDFLPMITDASPLVRAAAIRATVARFGTMSSDPKEQKRLDARTAKAKAAFAKLAKTETSNAVFYELGAAIPIPTFAGHASIIEDMVLVEIRCKDGMQATPLKVTAMRDGQPYELGAANLQLACGDALGGGVAKPFAPGTYQLAAQIAVGRHVENLQLGGFAVTGGEVTLAPE